MSRAAALAERKGSQKAAIAEKKAAHEADLAMGLNSTMAKLIKGDELLCTQCGATTMGPVTKCECVGGRRKPGPDYCCKQQLIDAAKARSAAFNAAKQKELQRQQDAVAGARTKKREATADMDLELQGDDIEVQVVVPFPVGKLGMSLELNCVSNVTGDPAQELGVKKGWVLFSVRDEEVPADKAEIAKIVGRIFKEVKGGVVEFKFRTPITLGYQFCGPCNKFQEEASFDAAQLEKGPGKQMCSSCEEFSGMF